MKIEQLQKRIDEIISLADRALANEIRGSGAAYVPDELFAQFKSSSLSYILGLYGGTHPHYLEFKVAMNNSYSSNVKGGRGILKAIKDEINGGWLFTIKGVVSAEIFADFMEMADYLLSEKYKDPAAVMAGSVLEEHLRQLCLKNNIPIETIKEERAVSKKADLLNSELASTGVYNKLDQKSITGWLDLRNRAAHGKYDEYTQQQVELMLQSVRDFIGRNSL